MLFLAVLGGAAVLEVHRAVSHRKDASEEMRELQEKEAGLRKQLQELQRDLRAAQKQRELTEAEAAQLSAVNLRLNAENESLSSTTASLKAENEELLARSSSLLERQAALEAAAESLKLENGTLVQQFDRLRLKHEAESSSFQEQLGELKDAVGGALSRFTQGEISADQLMAFLGAMGVELRGRKEDLERLPDQLNSARSTEERLKLLDRVEVEVSDSWLQQMRLTAAEPGRAARLMAGQAATRAGASASSSLLLEGPSAVAAGPSSNGAPFSPPKLPTPRRGLPATQLPAVKVPPLKLPASSGAGASSSAAPAQNENAGANALAAAPAPAAKEAGGKKKGGMRFLPGGKKARATAKKAPLSSRGTAQQPQLALDVPLGQGAAHRLPFDAALDDDMGGPGSRGMVAL